MHANQTPYKSSRTPSYLAQTLSYLAQTPTNLAQTPTNLAGLTPKPPADCRAADLQSKLLVALADGQNLLQGRPHALHAVAHARSTVSFVE
eukprot:1747080-Rhodomonas_salina.1